MRDRAAFPALTRQDGSRLLDEAMVSVSEAVTTGISWDGGGQAGPETRPIGSSAQRRSDVHPSGCVFCPGASQVPKLSASLTGRLCTFHLAMGAGRRYLYDHDNVGCPFVPWVL